MPLAPSVVAASMAPLPVECPYARLTANNLEPQHTSDNLPISPPKYLDLSRPTMGINKRIRSSFMKSIKYTMTTWFPYCYGNQSGPINPNGVDQRAASTAVYATAVSLKTGAYDEESIGLSYKAALFRTKRLLIGIALKHRSHLKTADSWGYSWQSSYWAYYIGAAAWLLYEDLSPTERQIVAKVVESEADYQLSKKSNMVKYYANKDGIITYPGDTKAEEDAWDSTILSIAAAMMPLHHHAFNWRVAEAKLQAGSYARQSDLSSTKILNGIPVKNWIDGWNVYNDGTVINHKILSPEYMANIAIKLNGVQMSNLAGCTSPRTSVWNADVIYNSFIDVKYASPPYEQPGGTVYTPKSYNIYFPEGNDWGTQRVSNYLVMDGAAATMNFAPREEARAWMKIHNTRQSELQSRFEDGRTYSGKSNDEESEYKYSGREQVTAGDLAQLWLGQYLSYNNLLKVNNSPLAFNYLCMPTIRSSILN